MRGEKKFSEKLKFVEIYTILCSMNGDIRIEWEGVRRGRYRVLLSYNNQNIIQVDAPEQIDNHDFFTVFWRGRATLGVLYKFISSTISAEDKGICTLFFFSGLKKRIPENLFEPPCLLENFPTKLEKMLIMQHGSPRFVRYEIYPELFEKPDLEQSRFVVWASLDTDRASSNGEREENEVGVYSGYDFLEVGESESAIQNLICETAAIDVELPIAGAFIDLIKSKLIQRRVL